MARYCEHNRETDSTGNVDCPWCTDDKIMKECYAWMARAEKAEAELEAVKAECERLKRSSFMAGWHYRESNSGMSDEWCYNDYLKKGGE